MKKLILHIGTNKTGSTSIQTFLCEKASELSKQNVCYPAELHSHNRSIFSLIGTGQDKPIQKKIKNYDTKVKRWRKLWDDVFRNEAETTVISAEQMTFFSKSEILKLLGILEKYYDRIVIVCYVRDYNSYLTSEIQQRMKMGRESIRHELLSMLESCDYSWVVNWIDCHSNHELVIRPFKTEVFHNGDLIQDFFHISEMDFDGLDNKNVPRVNQSIGLNSVLLLSRFNEKYPLIKKKELNKERGLHRRRVPVSIFASIKDQPFRLDVGYTQKQADGINKCINRINPFLPEGGKLNKVIAKPDETEELFQRDIPKPYYMELFAEYDKYLKNILDRSCRDEKRAE